MLVKNRFFRRWRSATKRGHTQSLQARPRSSHVENVCVGTGVGWCLGSAFDDHYEQTHFKVKVINTLPNTIIFVNTN